MAMLAAIGIYFLFEFKGVQIRRIPEQVRLIWKDSSIDSNGNRMSSFQGFCMGLGQRIGIGNIIGVATAILLGGPGSIFWMWIFAVFGAATSFVESTLGQIFKRKNSNGQFYGGPAYYIKDGLKKHELAVFFAVWTVITYGVGFIANVSANVSGAFESLVDLNYMSIFVAVSLAALTAFLVFGGIMRMSRMAEKVVPYMAIGWLVLAGLAIILNWRLIDDVLILIVRDAFDVTKIVAGFAGSCIMWGIKRGIFSNEAGIGSIPCVSSTADVKHPIHQGYVQSMGVLIDTLVVCTASAFPILIAFPEGLSGLGYDANDGIIIVESALNCIFGGDWLKYVLTAFIFVFAFTSIVGNYSISESNLRFLTDKPEAITVHKSLAVAVVFVSAILPISLVWNIVDILMAIMSIVNVYVLFRLSKYVVSAHNDYRRQKDDGVEEPVFSVETLEKDGLDVSGVVSWDADSADCR